MVQNLKGEVWNTHPIYNWFAASNLGRIKHINNKGEEKLNKLTPNQDGYLQFGVYKGRKKVASPYVHRFCYECMNQCIIPDGCSKLQINHKNEIKTDNKIENLELCTPQYNIDYSKSKAVGQYTLDGELIRVWKSTREAGRSGFCSVAVATCCRGERKTHRGFCWQYIENENPPQKIDISKINKFKPKAVGQFTLDGELVKIWESTAECQRSGYSNGNIYQCCNNKYIKQGNNIYKGYIWKFIDE